MLPRVMFWILAPQSPLSWVSRFPQNGGNRYGSAPDSTDSSVSGEEGHSTILLAQFIFLVFIDD